MVMYQRRLQTHEQITLEYKLKLMRSQEAIEKVHRDIIMVETELRSIINDRVERLRHIVWRREYKRQKNNPQSL